MLNPTPNPLSSQSNALATNPYTVLPPLNLQHVSPLFRLQTHDRFNSLYSLASAVLSQPAIEHQSSEHQPSLDAWAESLAQDVVNAND
ncbi:MAG: hypothetical protein F6J87_26875 [Spirulina sp. SIO3F2]|nr:hypothetical protein [Spirulina sp. SIO3F2]